MPRASWLSRTVLTALAVCASVAFVANAGLQTAARAQDDGAPKFNLPGQLGLPQGGAVGAAGGPGEEDRVTFAAKIEATKGGPDGILSVTVTLEPDWHIYSVTQADGGPIRTKMTLASKPEIKLAGPFKPDASPSVRMLPEYPGLEIEEHSDKVVWKAPVTLPPDVDATQLSVQLKVFGQICKDGDSCFPVRLTVPVALAGEAPPSSGGDAPPSAGDAKPPKATSGAPKAATPTVAGKPGPYRSRISHVSIDGHLAAKSVKAGDKVNLIVTAKSDATWHVYGYDPAPPTSSVGFSPTLIAVQLPAGWKAGPAEPDSTPLKKDAENGAPAYTYHEKTVKWTIPIQVGAEPAKGKATISGSIGSQTCSGEQCAPPQGAAFQLQVDLADATTAGQTPLLFASLSYSKVSEQLKAIAAGAVTTIAAADSKQADSNPADASDGSRGGGAKPSDVAGGASGSGASSGGATPSAAGLAAGRTQWKPRAPHVDENASLGTYLMLALVGGFILNFMPCVLPVIGLKVMAFVAQGQGDRRQIFMLNFAYSLGIIFVFLVLATAASLTSWTWGKQFQSTGFNVVLAGFVFVFGLSLLGVWEIPIPGFASSGTASEMADNEGLFGAFCKGIFTTILATPCTGPFMGSALAWAFKQPAPVIFATFFTLGLGMALPYLLVGVFPKFLKFLPKPGAWMDTFKQIMGFTLMGTVVLFLSFIKADYVVATCAMLVGLGLGCWWIGRTPIYAEFTQKATAWVLGAAMAGAVGLLGYVVAGPKAAALPWQKFDRTALEKMVAEGKTVMVDFTADWCPNCKTNEFMAYNTKETLALIKELGVVPVKADITHLGEPEVEEAEQLLRDLGHKSEGIPLLVIFPAGSDSPIMVDSLVSQGKLTRLLKEEVARGSGAGSGNGDTVAKPVRGGTAGASTKAAQPGRTESSTTGDSAGG